MALNGLGHSFDPSLTMGRSGLPTRAEAERMLLNNQGGSYTLNWLTDKISNMISGTGQSTAQAASTPEFQKEFDTFREKNAQFSANNEQLGRTVSHLSSAVGDLSASVEVQQQSTKLQANAALFSHQSANAMADASQNLADTTVRVNQAANQLGSTVTDASSTMNQVSSNIDQVGKKVGTLSDNLGHVDGKVGQLSGNLDHVDGKVGTLSDNLDQVGKKTEKLSDTLNGNQRSAEGTQKSFEQMKENAEKANESAEKTNEHFQNMNERFEEWSSSAQEWWTGSWVEGRYIDLSGDFGHITGSIKQVTTGECVDCTPLGNAFSYLSGENTTRLQGAGSLINPMNYSWTSWGIGGAIGIYGFYCLFLKRPNVNVNVENKHEFNIHSCEEGTIEVTEMDDNGNKKTRTDFVCKAPTKPAAQVEIDKLMASLKSAENARNVSAAASG